MKNTLKNFTLKRISGIHIFLEEDQYWPLKNSIPVNLLFKDSDFIDKEHFVSFGFPNYFREQCFPDITKSMNICVFLKDK